MSSSKFKNGLKYENTKIFSDWIIVFNDFGIDAVMQ
jgi:hypothetical protein